jgi:hypothetical protein
MIEVWLAIVSTHPDTGQSYASVHLSQADAYEHLRMNYAEECSPGDDEGIEVALAEQSLQWRIEPQFLDFGSFLSAQIEAQWNLDGAPKGGWAEAQENVVDAVLVGATYTDEGGWDWSTARREGI